MEESWFIIFFLCFIVGGLIIIKVEISFMENFFIEYFSMFVYVVYNFCFGFSEASCGNDEYNLSGFRYVISILFFV